MISWICPNQQNLCQVFKFFLKSVVFRDDHAVLKPLWINDTFIATKSVIGEEGNQRHAFSEFSIKFCIDFSWFRKKELHILQRNSLFVVGKCVCYWLIFIKVHSSLYTYRSIYFNFINFSVKKLLLLISLAMVNLSWYALAVNISSNHSQILVGHE